MLLENAESSHLILNSPIGKMVVEDNDQHSSQQLSQSYCKKNNNSEFFMENPLFETDPSNKKIFIKCFKK